MRLFDIMSTAFDNFDNTVRTYLQKTFGSLGLQYTHSQIFGVIYDGIKGIMENAMFYIEDALTEQNVFMASRKKSVYSLAKVSGYEPYYGNAAVGTILARTKVNNGLSSTTTKLYLSNYTRIVNRTTGLTYIVMLPSNQYVFDVSAPLVTHELKVVQGRFINSTYITKGEALEKASFDVVGLWDADYIEVLVNGEEWTRVSCLYDMTRDGHEYILTTGYENSFDIMFGNGVYGKVPEFGSTVSVQYIVHAGVSGNILGSDNYEIAFYDQGYDGYGNDVDLNDFIDIDINNVISGGTNADTIEFVRDMIGYTSRSGVLASEDNFRLFFKRFSFVGHVNCWAETNSMSVIAVCTSNLMNMVKEPDDYYTLDSSKMILSDYQKMMISNTLENSNKAFAGLTLKFKDPIIRKFSILCYIKTSDVYSKPTIKQNVSDAFANYFMNLPENVQFIAKSDLITIGLKCDASIEAFDVNIVSEIAEQAFANGWYDKYELTMVNGAYKYTATQVFYEEGVSPGLDDYGNISLSSKLEVPMLNGSFKYYPNKADMDRTTNISMEPIQFFFI